MWTRFAPNAAKPSAIRRRKGNGAIGCEQTEQTLSLPEFLRTLFRLLDEHDLRYCVLHSYEGLPEHLASDLDLAIHPHDTAKLPLVFCDLENKGYEPVQCINYAGGANYFVFAWVEGLLLRTVALDVITEHRRGGLILASGEELVARRRKRTEFWAPALETEFSYLLAKKTLKKSMTTHQERRLELLVAELGREQAERTAGSLFGRKWARQLVEACVSGNAGRLLKKLGTQLWWTKVRRNPLNGVQYGLAEMLRGIRRWSRPTGLFVAVLGPDGVGKSTLLRGLNRQLQGVFRRTRWFHWRPGLLWRRNTSGPVTDPHGQTPHGPWWSVARLLAYLLDYWLGYWLIIRPLLARSGLVVFDRYCQDLLADPRRYRYGGPAWVVRAVCRISPQPQLLLILDAPEEVILYRKQEVRLEEVRRQRQAYLALRDQFHAEVIDAGLSSAKTVADATCAIAETLARRFQDRSVHRLRALEQTLERALAGSLGYDNLTVHPSWNDPRTLTTPAGRSTAIEVRSSGETNGEQAHANRHCFAVLPCGNGPRRLVPLGNIRATLRGLDIYTPYALRARIAKGLLVGCIKAGWIGWARDRLQFTSAAQLPLEALVGEVTGERSPVFSLSLGTATRYPKLAIQVMRPDGEIIGYIKLPLTDETMVRVRQEAVVLQRLGSAVLLRPHVPRVLYAGEWQGGYVLFEAPGRGRPGPVKFTELHEQFLKTLWTVCPLERSGQTLVEEAAARWQKAVISLDSDWQQLGEKALQQAGRVLAGATLPCGVVHGDFAPWNTRVEGSRLFVFDWESTAWTGPHHWDQYHFRVQVASLLHRPLRSAANCVDSPADQALFLLYLLNSVSLLIEQDGQSRDRSIEYRKKLILHLLEIN